MKAIVAVDLNWGIGCKGKLLERIPDDMKFFKQKTVGKIVLMGRETFVSLPGGEPLKDRLNIVLCEDKQFSDKKITVCSSLNELFGELKKYPTDEVFVIGGEIVYAELLPYCSEAYVTKIENIYEADKYFVNLDEDERWELISTGESKSFNGIRYSLTKYKNNVLQK
ncbi:MAG: dihydrofolate reductase [Firmicutes bacterium HGW-Firmicutes-15]|nr:MAG: dihydrofolate reductase [Firmicutes bacterium HGW-Firmicutes-15]